MKVHGKIEVVSAIHLLSIMNRLISNAPYGSHTNTVPETEEYWTNAIIGIRGNVPDQRFSRSIEEEVDLAVAFAQCFGGRWKLPMAVFCFTLLPRDETDTDLLKIFSRLQLTGNQLPFPARSALLTILDADREACFATGTKITRPANLPELAQFHRFMQVYYLGHCANKINGMSCTAHSS